jgi:predicted Rdx family selenoprotein
MFKHPGFESFQAFRDLRIKSLLYYQAELVKLRQELHILEWENHSDGGFPSSKQLSERLDFLLKTETMSSLGDPEGKGKKQILKIKEIERVLKEYGK